MLRMNALLIVRSAIVAVVLIGSYSVPQSADSILVKIDRLQGSAIAEEWAQQVKIIQELATCTIAEIPGDLLTRFHDRQVSFEVLDTRPAGKPFYLVYTSRLDDEQLLESLGNVRVVEDGILLYWTDTEDVRETLPADLELKRLPSETPLRFEPKAPSPLPEPKEEVERLAPPFPHPRIHQMVAEVRKENLSAHIQSLQGFETRYATTVNCQSAGTYIHDFFAGLGLQSYYDPFNFGSSYASRNIIGVLPGKTVAEQVVIVCAHYDSTSTQAATRAPGADDNASGTAAVMEAARVMRNYSFDFTIKFICFSAEEFGLWGSKHYAQQAKQAGERVLAVINLDMIGYANSVPEDLDIIVNPRSEWLADRFILASNAYADLGLLKRINASFGSSDHSPFWDQGYSALCGIEDAPVANPYYHRPTDTLDTLDLDFLTAAAKASLAALADLAQPESVPPAPSGVSARSQVHKSLFSRFKTVYLSWNAGQQPVAGYKIYRSGSSGAGYRVISTLSTAQTSFKDRFLDSSVTYFYVVTAVDAQGRESNYSIEVRDDENNPKK